jgi:hypothetical protein
LRNRVEGFICKWQGLGNIAYGKPYLLHQAALFKANWFALRIPSAFMSRPVTLQPVVWARCKAYTPEPQPISNTDELRVSFSRLGICSDSSFVT